MDEAVKEVAEVVDAIKSGRIPPPNKAQTIVICEKVLELGVMLSEARCELKEAQSLLDRIGDALEDVDYKGDYADGVKALLLRSNAVVKAAAEGSPATERSEP